MSTRFFARIKAAARGLTATLAREYAATRLAQIRLAIANDEASIVELRLDLQRLRLAELELQAQFEPDTPALSS